MASTFLYNDANIKFWHKLWASRSGLGCIETVRMGAQFYLAVTLTGAGQTGTVQIRTAALQAGGVAAANAPVITVFGQADLTNTPDNPQYALIPPTQLSVGAGPQFIAFGTALPAGDFLFRFIVDATAQGQDGIDAFTVPYQSVQFQNLSVSGVAVSKAIPAGWLQPHKMLALGDSIPAGFDNDAGAISVAGTKSLSRSSFLWTIADYLQAELLIDCFGSQGISKGQGASTVPGAYWGGTGIATAGPGTWNSLQAGLTGTNVIAGGLYTDAIGAGDYIFDFHGQNDGTLSGASLGFTPATNAGRQAAFQNYWHDIHAPAPNAKLVIVNVLNSNAGAYADKAAAMASYVDAFAGGAWLIDLGTAAQNGIDGPAQAPNRWSNDTVGALHPNYEKNARIARQIVTALYALQNPASSGTAGGISC